MSSAEEKATLKYFHSGPFNRAQIRTDFATKLAKESHYNSASIPNLEMILAYMEVDARITDVRWMAYMLATAYWETSHIEKIQKPTFDKKGKPVLDKAGNQVTKQIKVWRNMSPVEESDRGKGRNYFQPVKVKRLADGTAIVTEHDGDQWTVALSGVSTVVNKNAKRGAAAADPAAAGFTKDDGTEHAYYGRGYVQLTWWNNYASTGVAIGEGLNLLFEPERALEPKIAYAVMARGMITGDGFANGHKLSKYFHGAHTDYKSARKMVNGTDHADDIAAIAELFEAVLLANKVTGSDVATGATWSTLI
jgi:hypothetical protein